MKKGILATKELATRAAISRNCTKLPLATKMTDWNVLEVRVSEESAFNMVKDGWLQRDGNTHGWRLKCQLDFGTLSHQWYRACLPPMGLEEWADLTLTSSCTKASDAVCSQCMTSCVVWTGGYDKSWYCAACWYSFFVTT